MSRLPREVRAFFALASASISITCAVCIPGRNCRMRRLTIPLMALVGLVASIATAHAQFVDFSAVFNPNPVPTDQPGSSAVVLNGMNSSGVLPGSNGTDIVLGNITVNSNAPDNSPAHINSPYTIALTLQQATSTGAPIGSPITEDFTGHLLGTLSTSTTNIANTYNAPLTDTFDFGNGQIFSVTLTSYTAPSGPGGAGAGAFGARMFGPVTGQVADTPEPGSLAL